MSSFAHTTKTSAIGEFVIQFFDPFNIYEPSYYLTALEFILFGSDPTFGSVKPKHPIISPDINPGRYLSFKYLFPNLCIGWITKDDCTDNADL